MTLQTLPYSCPAPHSAATAAAEADPAFIGH